MIFHKIWIINCGLSLAVIITCIVGDKCLEMTHKPQIFRAIADNLAHALIGLLSCGIVIIENADNFYLAFICLIISSLIDIDHFITARSLRLVDATNLQHRPFLHNSTIPLVLIFILIYCHLSLQHDRLTMLLITLIIAFSTHHIRDANRRGLLFNPFFQTPPLSKFIYIGSTLIVPYLFKYFFTSTIKLKSFKTTTPKIFEV